MENKRALDIFKLFDKINAGDFEFYDKLTAEEKKEFSALIFMRWLSGTSDSCQVVMLNNLVNEFVFNLGKHPTLLAKLLVVATTRKQKRYQWLKANSKAAKCEERFKILSRYYNLSTREAKQQLNLLKTEQYLELAAELGYQKDELEKLRKECNAAG